jgi:hypothetical protein
VLLGSQRAPSFIARRGALRWTLRELPPETA